MTKKSNELIFISQILRDGSGVIMVDDDGGGENYELTRLSITHDTYIASGFNSYVVKIK